MRGRHLQFGNNLRSGATTTTQFTCCHIHTCIHIHSKANEAGTRENVHVVSRVDTYIIFCSTYIRGYRAHSSLNATLHSHTRDSIELQLAQLGPTALEPAWSLPARRMACVTYDYRPLVWGKGHVGCQTTKRERSSRACFVNCPSRSRRRPSCLRAARRGI